MYLKSVYLFSIEFLFILLIITARSVCTEEEYIGEEFEEDLDDQENSLDTRAVRPAKEDFVGTNLFGENACIKKCFSPEDIALLSARKEFESLIPKDSTKCLLDDEQMETLMEYFYAANKIILKITKGNSKIYAQKAFYDTLGGYLSYYLIPVSKFSFYAGVMSLKSVENVYELLRQCRIFLNTNGNGWKPPVVDFVDFNINIEPLKVFMTDVRNSNRNDGKACVSLNLADENSENDEEMIVSLPQLERDETDDLWNIWLPFKRKHSFNLRSNQSAFILLKYFVTVTKCYQFQGVNEELFIKKFKAWLQENIESHLGDDALYPGLGAVLRILETIKYPKNYLSSPEHSGNFDKNLILKTGKSRVNRFGKSTKEKGIWERIFEDNTKQNTENSKSSNSIDYEAEDLESLSSRKTKYITVTIIVILVLLIFIIFVAIITKYMTVISDKNERRPFDKKSKNSDGGICPKLSLSFRGSKKSVEEEIALVSRSPSVVGSKPTLRKSRSSFGRRSQNYQTSPESSPPPPHKIESKTRSKCASGCNKKHPGDTPSPSPTKKRHKTTSCFPCSPRRKTKTNNVPLQTIGSASSIESQSPAATDRKSTVAKNKSPNRRFCFLTNTCEKKAPDDKRFTISKKNKNFDDTQNLISRSPSKSPDSSYNVTKLNQSGHSSPPKQTGLRFKERSKKDLDKLNNNNDDKNNHSTTSFESCRREK